MSTVLRRAACVTTLSLTLAGVAVPAIAAPASATVAHRAKGLHGAKQAALRDIDLRLAALASDAGRVARDGSVTAGHRDALAGTYTRDTATLLSLRAQVVAATTVAAVQADRSAAIGLRVFALVGPVTNTVVVDDDLAARASKLDVTLSTRTSATARGRQLLANARTLLHLTQSLTSDATATVFALTPADALNGVTPVEISEARSQTSAAGYDLRAARKDVVAAKTFTGAPDTATDTAPSAA